MEGLNRPLIKCLDSHLRVRYGRRLVDHLSAQIWGSTHLLNFYYPNCPWCKFNARTDKIVSTVGLSLASHCYKLPSRQRNCNTSGGGATSPWPWEKSEQAGEGGSVGAEGHEEEVTQGGIHHVSHQLYWARCLVRATTWCSWRRKACWRLRTELNRSPRGELDLEGRILTLLRSLASEEETFDKCIYFPFVK